MGTLINFISQHIHIPLSPSAKERASDYFAHQPCAFDDQRERALQQFPCEDKHSFNPHYQHNLVSTSPPSNPPSLSSSPSTSSPSSAFSASSSFSRATGARSFSQDSYKQNHTIGHDYSYNRRYNRRQNLRCYTYQQQQEHYHDDWMFGITDDDDYSSSAESEAAGPSMTRVCPQESPISPNSSSAVSLKSSLSRKPKTQRGSVMSVFATARSTVTFSPVVLEHPARKPQPSSSLGLLPSISESSLTSSVSDSSAAVATVSTSSQKQSTGSLTAQQSLMRIAQCSKSEEGWCSQQSGQCTKRYAEATTRTMMVDGRRSRRL